MGGLGIKKYWGEEPKPDPDKWIVDSPSIRRVADDHPDGKSFEACQRQMNRAACPEFAYRWPE